MKDIGSRIKEEVEAKLGSILAEEELAAMIDAAIPVARDRLQRIVQEKTNAVFEKGLEPLWRDRGYGHRITEEDRKFGNGVADHFLEILAEQWKKEADAVAGGKSESLCPAAKVVRYHLEAQLELLVQERMREWRNSPEANEKADAILENLIPRAGAMFLEQAALSALGSLGQLARKELSVTTAAQLREACPHCAANVLTCPKCGHLTRPGASCCGEIRR